MNISISRDEGGSGAMDDSRGPVTIDRAKMRDVCSALCGRLGHTIPSEDSLLRVFGLMVVEGAVIRHSEFNLDAVSSRLAEVPLPFKLDPNETVTMLWRGESTGRQMELRSVQGEFSSRWAAKDRSALLIVGSEWALMINESGGVCYVAPPEAQSLKFPAIKGEG